MPADHICWSSPLAAWVEFICCHFRCLIAESAYCAAMLALWRHNRVATTWVFLVPHVVTSFALMFGNWYASLQCLLCLCCRCCQQLLTYSLHLSVSGNKTLACRSQHIFIDPRQPRTSYSMTYNCINSADNQKTFNDGYHIQVTMYHPSTHQCGDTH